MRILAVLIAASIAASAQSIVSYGTPSGLSHSDFSISATTSGSFSQSRVLIIKSGVGDCASGSLPGGPPYTTTDYWAQDGPFGPSLGPDYMSWIVGGLAASTNYNVCPQVWNGSSYVGTGGHVNVTTLALPAVHPAKPTAPTQFNPTYPTVGTPDNCSGAIGTPFCIDTTLENNACTTSAWDTAIAGAVGRQAAHGTVISLKNSICHMTADSFGSNFHVLGQQPDMVNFTSSAITVDTGTTDSSYINSTNCCGGGLPLPDGSLVIFGLSGATMFATTSQPDTCRAGIEAGFPYYTHRIDNDHFSLYCGAPKASGGTYLPINNAGSTPGGSHFIFVPADRHGISWIMIDGGVDDAHFVPFGNRVTPALGLTTGGFQRDDTIGNGMHSNRGMLEIGDPNDGSDSQPMGKIWVRGVQMRAGTTELDYDPMNTSNLFNASIVANNYVVDRSYIYFTPGQRAGWGDFEPMGYNVGIYGDYMDNLTQFMTFHNGLGASGSGTSTLTLVSGYAGMSASNPRLDISGLTVNAGGSSTGTFSIFTGMFGDLNVSMPPGNTVTCSGSANCNPFVADTVGGAVIGTVGAFPSTGLTAAGCTYCMVAVDPVYSTSNACSSTENLFGPKYFNNDFATSSAGSNEWGTRFTVTTSGFICGARLYKVSSDSLTAHTFNLWNSGGTLMATKTSSGESASGYQVVTFTTPQAVTAGSTYVISFGTTQPIAYMPNINQNYGMANFYNGNTGKIQARAIYAARTSGDCSINSAVSGGVYFPHNNYGNVMANPIECGTMSGSSFGSLLAGNIIEANNVNNPFEGTAWLNAYKGPGPIHYYNTYMRGAGNLNHFDGGNGTRGPGFAFSGADFEIQRFYTKFDFKFMPSNYASSDGNFYGSRQPWEWKAGWRIDFTGNVFDGSFSNASLGGPVELDAVETLQGINNVNFENNTMMHLNSTILGPNPVVGGTPFPAFPINNFQFNNNLVYDVDGIAYHPITTAQTQRGDLFLSMFAGEDVRITHNTFVGQNGVTGLVLSYKINKEEGILFSNNFLQFNQGDWGSIFVFRTIGDSAGTDICGNSPGSGNAQAQFSCMSVNSVFNNNAILPGNINNSSTKTTPAPGGVLQSTVNADWPDGALGTNSRPNNTLDNVGFWQFYSGNLSKAQNGWPGEVIQFQGTSSYCSGCSFKATDGSDLGVNYDTLLSSQGQVQAISVTGISTSGATVNFLAPDSNGCPVDYGTDSTGVTFSRASDAGGNRVRNISITGLSSGQIYYYRIDCESANGQPTGSFQTQ